MRTSISQQCLNTASKSFLHYQKLRIVHNKRGKTQLLFTSSGRKLPVASVLSSSQGFGDSVDNNQEKAANEGVLFQLKSLFTVYSDPACNARLLVLIIGQMLCSVATLIHDSYLPVYAQDVLGLSNTSIGAVQGLAQFLCQLTKGVSGVVGDVLGSQVRVLVFGTFLTLLCKPMFVMLSSVHTLAGASACLYFFFTAKLLDRMSKGIREAPTKAVMNELARESGDAPDAAYGLRQSLATAGMLVGSSIAALTFTLTGSSYEYTFAAAMFPPALALLWMISNFKAEIFGSSNDKSDALSSGGASMPITSGQQEGLLTGASLLPGPPSPSSSPDSTIMACTSEPGLVSTSASNTTAVAGMIGSTSGSGDDNAKISNNKKADQIGGDGSGSSSKQLSLFDKGRILVMAFKPVYWQALLVVAALYFSRFDASFLSLRAKSVIAKSALPLLTLTNTLFQVLLTAPLAKFSGKSVRNRKSLLLVGFVMMMGADACFGLDLFATPAGMFLGAALLGLHMALTHSITVSMIASYMPTGEVPGLGKLSGTAVSFTDLLLGFVLVASNTCAGVLSDVTRQAGYGNVGCFGGGAVACGMSALLLIIFDKFGDLGKDELVIKRAKKLKAS
ncbi:hypothetical protein CEUSTIGMA_g9716.t1 [Chlamydomonas eustigma]|uniref:Major facilitator superfamily (MFS) profile domain-containing protein n=1 Tax=Chlamydomonas eustigma TaxID=1157962 RepID=A0A250XGT3_9CHLO|nr:hypothetical protein CEUSTIGMA_g9716.t1 [Chlamydomonas eustigma]|eukprot:GAX82287.1 hypothetical protein CEUSTIGMA_g9716.t1 [Chlamydomonas eustigma]